MNEGDVKMAAPQLGRIDFDALADFVRAAERAADAFLHVAQVMAKGAAMSVAEVDRIMRVFEEAGCLERQRLAGRRKVQAALRQGRSYAEKRRPVEDYWEHLPIARAMWGNLR